MSKLIKDKVILGIDPGTNLMGYGVLQIINSKPSVVTLGVIDLRKYANHYLKLGHIHERVQGIIESYLPDEVAIEAPFFGKNVRNMILSMHTRICIFPPSFVQWFGGSGSSLW